MQRRQPQHSLCSLSVCVSPQTDPLHNLVPAPAAVSSVSTSNVLAVCLHITRLLHSAIHSTASTTQPLQWLPPQQHTLTDCRQTKDPSVHTRSVRTISRLTRCASASSAQARPQLLRRVGDVMKRPYPHRPVRADAGNLTQPRTTLTLYALPEIAAPASISSFLA